MKNAIAKDLTLHLDQRINQALDDYVDRCETMDIHIEHATTSAITVLGFHLVAVAAPTGCDENQFIEMCRWHFRQMKEQCAA